MSSARTIATADCEGEPRLAFRDLRRRWCSEGRRLLDIAATATRADSIAAGLGISAQAFSQIRSGRNRPGVDRMGRIWLVLRIEVVSWYLAPTTKPTVDRIASTPNSESRIDEQDTAPSTGASTEDSHHGQ